MEVKYADENLYFNTSSPLGFKIPGVVRGQDRFILPDTYPNSVLALRSLKKVFKDVKASQNAMVKIKEIKSIPERIQNLELTTKYKEVFEKGGRDPFPYQVEDIETMLHYDNLALLLEQGLGKTYIAIMALAIMAKQRPIKALVLAPRIVLPNWVKELKQFSDFKPLLYRGDMFKRRELQSITGWDVMVTNYETLVERGEMSPTVLFEWWAKLGEDKRREILPEEHKHLLKDKKTKKYRLDVSRVLKKLPKRTLFLADRTLFKMGKEMSDLTYLKDQKFDVVILDEGSRVKGAKAQRSNAVKELCKDIPRRYILSGTLCLGDPRDVYMPMTILNNSIFGENYYVFLKRYTTTSPYNKHVILSFRNLEDLKQRMDPYLVSRKREDNLALPERIQTERFYDLSKTQADLYNKIIDEDVVELKGETINTSIPIVKINKLLQVLNGFVYSSINREDEECGVCPKVVDCVVKNITPANKKCLHHNPDFSQEPKLLTIPGGTTKLDLLKEDIQDLVSMEKIIIWANYKYDLEMIGALLNKTKIRYITPLTENCAQLYEEDDNIRVFLGQVKQGIGITLNKATTTIYYSHTLDLEARLQSMDRNYRIGQKKPVVIRDYIGQHSLEEDLVALLQRKEHVKNILQSKPQCMLCSEMQSCTKNNIEPYSKACCLYDGVKGIEKKNKLKIRKIPNE